MALRTGELPRAESWQAARATPFFCVASSIAKAERRRFSLKGDPRRELNNPRIVRRGYGSERARVEVRVDAVGVELRMVEDVKELDAKLDCGPFRDLSLLRELEVEIVEPGAMNDVAAGVAFGTDNRRRERANLARWRARRATSRSLAYIE